MDRLVRRDWNEAIASLASAWAEALAEASTRLVPAAMAVTRFRR